MNAYDVRVLLKSLEDTSTSESLLTETSTDVTQDAGLESVVLVEEILECRVSGTESVEEVLCEDPTGVSVSGFLNRELRVSFEERVVGENV